MHAALASGQIDVCLVPEVCIDIINFTFSFYFLDAILISPYGS